jgi:hypothetical protein
MRNNEKGRGKKRKELKTSLLRYCHSLLLSLGLKLLLTHPLQKLKFQPYF